MKLDTQRDRWQAVLDGYELINISGVRVKMIDGYLHAIGRMGVWDKTFIEFLNDSEDWQLYKPPKPENKVIVIEKANDKEFKYFVLYHYHNTENDAIRAAMEWIGGKAKRVAIKYPDWFAPEDEGYRARLGCWGATELNRLELALIMRWPIEVLEEV